jgi:hypothetical protein
VRRGPQPNQIYELNKDIITLGRDITNDITINDPECSRHHARLTRDPNGYIIEDLGSTNGTFVNGQRLTGARLLMAGETIGMGETVTLAYEAANFASPAPAYAPPQPAAPDYMQQAKATELAAPNNPPAYNPPASPYAPPGAVAPAPQTPYGAQPPAAMLPYGAPVGGSPYAPPGQVPPDYGYGYGQQPPQYAYEEESGSGWMRWLLLGCGCFMVLCIIGAVVGVIVVDSTCAWKEEPLISILDTFGLEPDTSSSACQ